MTDWQPIKTAPKDRLIWLAMPACMRVGFWREGEQYENHGTVGGGWIDLITGELAGVQGLRFAPTHWLPTPDPVPAEPTP